MNFTDASDTDPFELVALDILKLILDEIELHHGIAGEDGEAKGQARIISAPFASSDLSFGDDLSPLARASEFRELGNLRILLSGLIVGVAVAPGPRDRVLRLGAGRVIV